MDTLQYILTYTWYIPFVIGWILGAVFLILNFNRESASNLMEGKSISQAQVEAHRERTKRIRKLLHWTWRLVALSLILFFLMVYLKS